MKLILAQGNPGNQYIGTRHNVGWAALDTLASELDTSFKLQAKFSAHVAEVTIRNEKILLVKPTTFYNETGRSARALTDFYKLDPSTDILVLHDDLSLPLGTVRIRDKGSDAGNNGIKSLNSHLGMHYWRIRIGIWNELRDRMPDVDFVLGKFTKSEQEILQNDILPLITSLVQQFAEETLSTTSHSL